MWVHILQASSTGLPRSPLHIHPGSPADGLPDRKPKTRELPSQSCNWMWHPEQSAPYNLTRMYVHSRAIFNNDTLQSQPHVGSTFHCCAEIVKRSSRAVLTARVKWKNARGLPPFSSRYIERTQHPKSQSVCRSAPQLHWCRSPHKWCCAVGFETPARGRDKNPELQSDY